MINPVINYINSEDLNIAYQVFGQQPTALLLKVSCFLKIKSPQF